MKIALISDIHSNYNYFKQVLAIVKSKKPDALYCLGDLVGYYDQPNEVIQTVIDEGIICVKGNHEKYLLGELTYAAENEQYYRVQEQRLSVKAEHIEFLRSLPDYISLSINGLLIYLTHSLPNDAVSYVYDSKAIPSNYIQKYDFYCYGHTHVPLIHYFHGCCVINPGSIGQPRDYTKQSSFAIIDFNEKSVEIIKVDVLTKEYIALLKSANFHFKLTDILLREKA